MAAVTRSHNVASKESNMGWHYDLRLVCPITGELEATEDMGMTFAQAVRSLERTSDTRYKHVLVTCNRPAEDGVHNVDIAYHVHMSVHEARSGWEFCGWVGTPTHDWFDADIAPLHA